MAANASHKHPVGAEVRTKYLFSGRRRLGVVERRDGMYVYVRLNIGYVIEAYDTELEPKRGRKRPK